MLNRRTLRIKAMQMLFAYKQRKEANYDISEDFIRETFSPDLNSMEFQDHDLLTQEQKTALELFRNHYAKSDLVANPDDKINGVVNEAIEDYYRLNDKDEKQIRNQMIQDVDNLEDSYISFLDLLLELHHQAGLDLKRNHSNFVKNLLIQGLKLNKSLEKAILGLSTRWEGKAEVRDWFRSVIVKDERFIEYNSLPSTSFEDDQKIVKYLINKVIFENEVIETVIEESDLYWDENKPVIKSLLLKTIKSISEENPSGFSLQEVSYNFKEDKEFFVRLFDATLQIPKAQSDLIGTKAKNWDIERLALTDRIILEMAISELINFPSIPIKVTINEYIEVSKKYSTPKSRQFINGMLDVIADELKADGVLRKSGRGLIDNK